MRNGTNSNNDGGGLYCTAGSLDVRNCVFTNNLSGGYGGGAVFFGGLKKNCTRLDSDNPVIFFVAGGLFRFPAVSG